MTDFARLASYFLKGFLEACHLYFLGFISSSRKMGGTEFVTHLSLQQLKSVSKVNVENSVTHSPLL